MLLPKDHWADEVWSTQGLMIIWEASYHHYTCKLLLPNNHKEIVKSALWNQGNYTSMYDHMYISYSHATMKVSHKYLYTMFISQRQVSCTTVCCWNIFLTSYHIHKSIVQEVQEVQEVRVPQYKRLHLVNPSQRKPLSSYSTQGTTDCKWEEQPHKDLLLLRCYTIWIRPAIWLPSCLRQQSLFTQPKHNW